MEQCMMQRERLFPKVALERFSDKVVETHISTEKYKEQNRKNERSKKVGKVNYGPVLLQRI